MLLRVVILLATALAAIGQSKIPVATFHGTVHGVSGKTITIETEDGNLVDFEINRKTRVLRSKKEIHASDLATGDIVTIDAKQEMVRFLVALTITAQPKD
jgi:hypothetical protein